jgi:plastocyanin
MHTLSNAPIEDIYYNMACLGNEIKIISLVLTAVAVSSLFVAAPDTTGNYADIAQTAATGAMISMARGSQSADNPEFYFPAENKVKAGQPVTWKNDDTAIHTATSGKDATPDGQFDTIILDYK